MSAWENVEATLGLIQSASETISKMTTVEESRRAAALAKLRATDARLRATTDRFFLKTRAGLPFARKCQEQAESLATFLQEPAPDGQQLIAAVDALEKAAKVLDERSLMQGFTVT